VGAAGFYLVLFLISVVLTALLGLISSWIDRKVTALVQARRGPPLLQPFYDLVKLLGKETLVPAGSNRAAFTLMPLVALAGVSLAATILLGNIAWQNGLVGPYRFVGDVIVVLYLLVVPSAALVIGASSSNNPFASVGASREVKMMSYELPMLLSVAAVLTLAAASENRVSAEAQRQIDRRLPPDSPLVSVAAKRSALKARAAEFERKSKERDDIVLEHFPEEAAILAGMRVEVEQLLKTAGPGSADLAAKELDLKEREDAIVQAAKDRAGKKSLLDLMTRLEEEAAALAAGGDSAEAERKTRQLQLLNRKRNALQRLPEVVERLAHLPGETADIRRSLKPEPGRGQLPPEGAVAPVVPLQFQELLTMRGSGPGRGPYQGLVERRVVPLNVRRNLGAPEEHVAAACGGLNEAGLAAAARGDLVDRTAGWLSLALCVLVVFMCVQAKLGLVPFDCAEADTEIAGGVLIEYGGPLLGVWKLVKAMMLFTLPVFLGMVFLGGFRFWVPGADGFWPHFWQAFASVAKYVVVLVFIVLVRNTNPRVRIDQAMRFFLGPMSFLALIALILAVIVHRMSAVT
jgi:formate hydrogenlyase subunit 4